MTIKYVKHIVILIIVPHNMFLYLFILYFNIVRTITLRSYNRKRSEKWVWKSNQSQYSPLSSTSNKGTQTQTLNRWGACDWMYPVTTVVSCRLVVATVEVEFVDW